MRPLTSPLAGRLKNPLAGRLEDRLNRRGSLERRDPRAPKRATLIALLLACAVLVTVDQTAALSPARRILGDTFGPAESGTSAVARPVTGLPGWFDSRQSLRSDIASLQAQNAQLRQQVRTSGFDRNRLAEYDGLTRTAQSLGYALVPAHVVAYGEAQSFTRTVTIDAGSTSGISADMTVVSADGLVGRVLRVSRSTATVLLAVDPDSTVGGRVGDSMDVGFVTGSGSLSRSGLLDLQLVDQSATPRRGDVVVTWGSGQQAPYVSGVPIGEVTQVWSSVRDSSKTAEVKPYVDFGALDLVGVVVPDGTKSDRGVIAADGSLK